MKKDKKKEKTAKVIRIFLKESEIVHIQLKLKKGRKKEEKRHINIKKS